MIRDLNLLKKINMEGKTSDKFEYLKKIFEENLNFAKIRALSNWNNSSYIDADIVLQTNLIKDTIYEVKQHDKLIHYTSLNALFEIINTGKLRLFNIAGMNDPHELTYALKGINGIDSSYLIEQPKNYFLISFCKYNTRSKYKEHFSQWRNYADNGNGVGIVFKLANFNLQNNWIDSYLGKVSYSKEGIQNIEKYFLLHQKIREEGKLSIANTPNLIFQLATLIKAPIWSEEREIRLFRFLEWEKYDWENNVDRHTFSKDVKATFKNGSVKYFIEIDLNNKERFDKAKKLKEQHEKTKDSSISFTEKDVFDIYPALKIEKIIFGYNIPNDIKHYVSKSINALLSTKLGYLVNFENSIFTDHFTN